MELPSLTKQAQAVHGWICTPADVCRWCFRKTSLLYLCYPLDITPELSVIQHCTQVRAYCAEHRSKYINKRFCSFQEEW